VPSRRERPAPLSARASAIRSAFLSRINARRLLNGEPPLRACAMWDGGQDARGVRHRSRWEELAGLAGFADLDPADWVQALFEAQSADARDGYRDVLPDPRGLRDPALIAPAGRLKGRRLEATTQGVFTDYCGLLSRASMYRLLDPARAAERALADALAPARAYSALAVALFALPLGLAPGPALLARAAAELAGAAGPLAERFPAAEHRRTFRLIQDHPTASKGYEP
jgi:hypothetical protein